MTDRIDLVRFQRAITTTANGTVVTGITAGANSSTSQLVLDSAGNVGVGTASPVGRLNVATGRALFGPNSELYAVGIGFNQTRVSGGQVYYLGASDATSPDLTMCNAAGLERMRVAANGNVGIGNTVPAHALSIAGALRTTAVSTNYVQSNATSITVNTSTPTAVCSVSITTLGKPVLLIVSGDRNPAADGNWHWGQFYRDSTGIGKQTIGQMSFASHNQPFSQSFVDTPAAGTYTYSFRVWFGQGSITYGETGDIQAPTIIAMELI